MLIVFHSSYGCAYLYRVNHSNMKFDVRTPALESAIKSILTDAVANNSSIEECTKAIAELYPNMPTVRPVEGQLKSKNAIDFIERNGLNIEPVAEALQLQHKDTISNLQYRLWELRENKSNVIQNSYAMCNAFFSMLTDLKKTSI